MKTPFEFIFENFFQESKSGGPRPSTCQLYQNYPNPFNETTTILYDLAENTKVVLQIYNVLGQKVRTLINEYQIYGNKSVVWDGTDNSAKPVSSGL